MESVTLRVARHDPDTGKSSWSAFHVRLQEKTTVLDCLDQIQKTEDSSLAFRYACRVGMCGSCAMVVNGKERWTCRTLVRDLRVDQLTIEPLRHLPVVRDLAVDFDPLWKKYRQVQPAFVAKPKPQIGAGLKERLRIDPNIECISCGACYSSCSFVGFDPLYLGPHAMNRVYTLLEDSRDAEHVVRLNIVDNEHGCWKCHTQMNCTEVCPVGISPSAGIQVLKQAVVKERAFSGSRRKFVMAAIGATAAAVAGFVLWQPKQWITVGPVDLIPEEGAQLFAHGGIELFLMKGAAGAVYTLSRRCSHQGCPVNWNAVAHQFECPCHKGIFNSAGEVIAGAPVRQLARIDTRIENGLLQVLI